MLRLVIKLIAVNQNILNQNKNAFASTFIRITSLGDQKNGIIDCLFPLWTRGRILLCSLPIVERFFHTATRAFEEFLLQYCEACLVEKEGWGIAGSAAGHLLFHFLRASVQASITSYLN